MRLSLKPVRPFASKHGKPWTDFGGLVRGARLAWRQRRTRNAILFTLAMLAIVRVGFYVVLPGVNLPGIVKSLMGH
jgi:hypothetical protein